jgi:hypothetical protein
VTYHVACGDDAPTLEDVVSPIRTIDYLDADHFAWQTAKWKRERPQLSTLYDRLETFLYELSCPKLFDTTAAEAALGGPAAITDALTALHETQPARRPAVEALVP